MAMNFSSTCLQEAEEIVRNASKLLAESEVNEHPLSVIENRRKDLEDAEQEVEYWECSVPFEGTLALREDELALSDGCDTIILEVGEPIEIFFAASWRRGFLGREPSGFQNYYFYNRETNFIGLTADGKALVRRIRARVSSEMLKDETKPFPLAVQPRAHVRTRVFAFLEDGLGHSVEPLQDEPYLIGQLPDRRGVVLVWGSDAESRTLTWQKRDEVVRAARQRGMATPLLIFAAANTAPQCPDIVLFYQLPACLTSEGARNSLQRGDEEENR